MRPAHKTISAGRLDEFESRLISTLEAALLKKEHPNRSFDRNRFAEAIRFAASF
jgi:hypothetical protein